MPRLSPVDRLLAWLVTGPVGRGLAFVIDLAVALARSARRDQPERRAR